MNSDELKEELEHNLELMKEHKRSLHILEIQAAKLGDYCPPYILNQISDTKQTIISLEQKIAGLIFKQDSMQSEIKSAASTTADPNVPVESFRADTKPDTESFSPSPVVDSTYTSIEATLLHTLNGHINHIWGLDFSADGLLLLSGSTDETIRIWDVNSGKEIRCLKTDTYSTSLGATGSVAFSPMGRILASGHYFGRVQFWRIRSGSQDRQIVINKHEPVLHLAFNSDGSRLATGGRDGTIVVLDVATSEAVHRLHGHGIATFNRSLSLLASKGKGRTVDLFDINTSQKILEIQTESDKISSLSLNPSGDILAIGYKHYALHLWDIANNRELHYLEQHQNEIINIAFGLGGQIIASGGADNTIRLWNIFSGRLLAVLETPGHVKRLKFSPDNRMLASGSGDMPQSRDNATPIQLWQIEYK